MKFYFKIGNVPHETISEPFVDPLECEMMLLIRDMTNGRLKKIPLDNILNNVIDTDRELFNRKM